MMDPTSILITVDYSIKLLNALKPYSKVLLDHIPVRNKARKDTPEEEIYNGVVGLVMTIEALEKDNKRLEKCFNGLSTEVIELRKEMDKLNKQISMIKDVALKASIFTICSLAVLTAFYIIN